MSSRRGPRVGVATAVVVMAVAAATSALGQEGGSARARPSAIRPADVGRLVPALHVLSPASLGAYLTPVPTASGESPTLKLQTLLDSVLFTTPFPHAPASRRAIVGSTVSPGPSEAPLHPTHRPPQVCRAPVGSCAPSNALKPALVSSTATAVGSSAAIASGTG